MTDPAASLTPIQGIYQNPNFDYTTGLHKGLWCQPYIEKIAGCSSRDPSGFMRDPYLSALRRELDRIKAAGFVGVAWHDFAPRLEGWAERLAVIALDQGLRSIAAFGLGDTRAAERGACIGRTSLIKGIDAVITDAEGSFENEPDDPSKATALVEAIVAVNKGALIIDQPWWKPTVHTKFPWREFSARVKAHAPQCYFNNNAASDGQDRYEKMMGGLLLNGQTVKGGYHVAWEWLEQSRILPPEFIRARTITIQGYHGADIAGDTIDCMTTYATDHPVFVWCEPWPEQYFIGAAKAFTELAKRGFTGPTAVHDFEVSAHLAVEPGHGRAGAQVLAALGIVG
jgi:hypothetical protein